MTVLRRKGELDAVVSSFLLQKPLPADCGRCSSNPFFSRPRPEPSRARDAAAMPPSAWPWTHDAGRPPHAHRFDKADKCRAAARGDAKARPRLLDALDAVKLNVPAWLLKRMQAAYGPRRKQAASPLPRLTGQPASLYLGQIRVSDPGLSALGGVVVPTGSIRLSPLPTRTHRGPARVPADGAWWVQDAAAALPALLLGDVAGLRRCGPLRGAGRQDGAARSARRQSDRRRSLRGAAQARR